MRAPGNPSEILTTAMDSSNDDLISLRFQQEIPSNMRSVPTHHLALTEACTRPIDRVLDDQGVARGGPIPSESEAAQPKIPVQTVTTLRPLLFHASLRRAAW